MHTLTENYLLNIPELPKVQPLSEFLFKIAKPEPDNINNIHALEGSLFSRYLGIAGTVDCIAEYNGELAIIDFKTSKNLNQKSGLNTTSCSVVRMHVCFMK